MWNALWTAFREIWGWACARWRRRIDHLEKAVLRAARNNGDELSVIETQQIQGCILRVGTWHYPEGEDAAGFTQARERPSER